MNQYRPRLSPEEYRFIQIYRQNKDLIQAKSEVQRNVLVVGDIHEPFSKPGYLEHCQKVYREHNCNQTIFIGDIIDQHYSSYHETCPDGLSAGDELEAAIAKLAKWYQAFPEATVTLGNHDLLVHRKVFSSGLSKRWIREYNEVLGVPNWKFVDEYEQDNVLYVHGTGTSGANAAWKRATAISQSVVCGHVHTEASVKWNVTRSKKFFAMMTGCGVDESVYAMEYGKNFPKKMVLSCAVVLNNGQIPILLPM